MSESSPPRRLGPSKRALAIGVGALVTAATLVLLLRSPEPVAVPKLEGPGCRETYERLYQRPVLDVRVVFGYKDARPARFVADRYERAIFTSDLIKPCGPGQSACGFSRDSNDADLLTRKITGPDGLPRQIRLTVTHSSAGADDESNRSDPYQTWQSTYARKTFEDGIRWADVVFYDGHSRSGGGPDFLPPQIGTRKHVIYSWYKANRPGLKLMEDTLNTSGVTPPLQLLGLFSCASDRLFTERLVGLDEHLGMIASDQLIYFSDALESMIAALSAVLGMKCQPEFEQALTARSPQAGTKLIGFFY